MRTGSLMGSMWREEKGLSVIMGGLLCDTFGGIDWD